MKKGKKEDVTLCVPIEGHFSHTVVDDVGQMSNINYIYSLDSKTTWAHKCVLWGLRGTQMAPAAIFIFNLLQNAKGKQPSSWVDETKSNMKHCTKYVIWVYSNLGARK